jgi:MscS family membrane protein
MSFFELIPYFAELPKWAQVWISWLLAFAIVIISIYGLRFLLTRVLLTRVRNLTSNTRYKMDDKLIEALDRPIRILTIGAGIALVSVLFDFNADVDRLSENLSSALVILSIFIFLYTLVDIVGFTSDTLRRITGLQVQERLLPFMRTIAKGFILVMAVLIILQEFGYNVTGLIASFGVVGLAFSLAAQDTAANVFGFTAIVSDNPFQVGDYIVTGDFAGTVEHVGVRSTRVRKLDQSLVTVPNSSLSDAAVTNWSRLSKRRLDFILGVGYETTSQQMRDLLNRLRDLLKSHENIDTDSVIVHFVEFGGSSLDIRLIAYMMLPNWGEYTAEVELVNLEIMEIVEEMGVNIAFPSRSIYIESLPQPEGERIISMPTGRPDDTASSSSSTADSSDAHGRPENPDQDNPTESSDSGDEGDPR